MTVHETCFVIVDKTTGVKRIVDTDGDTLAITQDIKFTEPVGVVLTSPNGTEYRLIVDNAGALSTEAA